MNVFFLLVLVFLFKCTKCLGNSQICNPATNVELQPIYVC